MTDHDTTFQPSSAFVTGEGHKYSGRELEAMDGASNYHRWILETFKPFLGQHLVEVGAGLGTFSEMLLQHLEAKLRHAGFKIILSNYFDLPGILPWWVKYRLLKSAAMERAGVKLYDRFVVPTTRRLESIISPPLGKNVIAIAQSGEVPGGI